MAIIRLVKTYQKFLVALFGILFIFGGTFVAWRWAKGDRFNFGEKGPTLSGTGLLVASSDPKGAQVYLNGKLTTATDDTLNLPPGEYEVEIKKDGFLTWKKKLQVEAELVTQTTAKLFPSVPNLTPLSFTGAKEPIPSPDGQKIVYRVEGADNEAKNGLWVLELSERSFATARTSEPKQIARTTSQYDFSTAKLFWTPDSSQILAYWLETQNSKLKTQNLSIKIAAGVLLGVGGMNDEADFKDATPRLPVMLSQWYQDLDEKDRIRIKQLPDFMQAVVRGTEGSEGQEGQPAARAAYFSPDEKRLLYVSDKDLTLPEGLAEDLPAESTQAEDRDVKVGSLYVYDIEEDRNYKVGHSEAEGRRIPSGVAQRGPSSPPKAGTQDDGLGVSKYWYQRLDDDRIRWEVATESAGQKKPVSLPPVPEELLAELLGELSNRYSPIWQVGVQWFPSSSHLVSAEDSGIRIVEYDGTNNSVVYSGPSEENFVYPWPNGSRLVIMTNFNDQSSPTNLYAINLR